MGNDPFKSKDDVETNNADETVNVDEAKAKAIRSALYETEQGSEGEELSANQVKKRDTLFGN